MNCANIKSVSETKLLRLAKVFLIFSRFNCSGFELIGSKIEQTFFVRAVFGI